MSVVEVHDKQAIAEFCRRRPGVHAYALGDLDDFFWPHTRWWAWAPDGPIEQLALVYDEPDPPVLLAIAETPAETMLALLRALSPLLPPHLYTHVTPGCLPGLTVARSLFGEALPHHKLSLDANALPPADDHERDADMRLLTLDELGEVERFYARAYPGTWFHARMLETRRYLGLRKHGELVSVAGVHVYSPTWGAAALGNVATVPAARGRGYGRLVCLALCRLLAADGISTISLNVKADNRAALAVYESLGFTKVADYLEATLR